MDEKFIVTVVFLSFYMLMLITYLIGVCIRPKHLREQTNAYFLTNIKPRPNCLHKEYDEWLLSLSWRSHGWLLSEEDVMRKHVLELGEMMKRNNVK